MKGKKDLRVFLSLDLKKEILVIFIAISILLMLSRDKALFYFGLAFACIWVPALGMYLLSVLRAGYHIRNIEQEGNLDSVLQDFENAKPALNGKLYFGENYLFGKASGRVIRYEEMFVIYQYVSYSKYNYENGRALKVVLKTGKEVSLCALKHRGEEDAESEEAVARICSHNPKIYVDPEKHIRIGLFKIN